MLIGECRELWKWRELLWQMVGREVKARYKQSFLGYFWVIINPFAQMVVMSLAFSVIMRVPTMAAPHIPYPVFLFVGLLPWMFFANSLSGAVNSLVVGSGLLTKVYFPRTVLVLATIMAKAVDFLFSVIPLVGYMVVYSIGVNWQALWLVPILLIQLVFMIGLGLFLAAANLLYRDVQYLLALVLTLWMYLTPIIYPVDIVPMAWKWVFQINPMRVLVNAYRQVLLGGGQPNVMGLLLAAGLSLLTLIVGLAYFKSREKVFADNV